MEFDKSSTKVSGHQLAHHQLIDGGINQNMSHESLTGEAAADIQAPARAKKRKTMNSATWVLPAMMAPEMRIIMAG